MSDLIEPFHLAIAASEIEDLRDRLARTRWPEPETVEDWSQGVPLQNMRALCDYWRTGYDWRRCESLLNGFGQFHTTIDGLGIHFLHIRSPESDALPLVMTHGWPGSVMEFHKVIGPLTNPAAHGGNSADAFHLVLPSMPGYGFSDKPTGTGWNVMRIADAWITLMERLGYDRYGAQGGDWGSGVTQAIGLKRPAGCVAIHLNMASFQPTPDEIAQATDQEKEILAANERYEKVLLGYSKEQSTRPQTIGYALADSPVGQAAWIYEKFQDWTDNQGTPESILSRDEMLDNIMLYWLTNTGASSARLYWEHRATYGAKSSEKVDIPTGFSMFPKEISRSSRRWAERRYSNIIHWNELEKGGHFAAFEQPELFVNEIRNSFRSVRGERQRLA